MILIILIAGILLLLTEGSPAAFFASLILATLLFIPVYFYNNSHQPSSPSIPQPTATAQEPIKTPLPLPPSSSKALMDKALADCNVLCSAIEKFNSTEGTAVKDQFMRELKEKYVTNIDNLKDPWGNRYEQDLINCLVYSKGPDGKYDSTFKSNINDDIFASYTKPSITGNAKNPPKILSNIEKQIQNVKLQQEIYFKKTTVDIPELKKKIISDVAPINLQLKTVKSQTTIDLLKDEIKDIAQKLLVLEELEAEYKNNLIKLQIIECSLCRKNIIGDQLVMEQLKAIDDLNKNAADAGIPITVNIERIIGSGTISEAKIQEKTNELLTFKN